MMVSLGVYVRKWQRVLRRWMLDSRIHTLVQGGAYILSGFLLSAASLGQFSQPLALGLLCALSGWSAVLMAVGAVAGYGFFWTAAGSQGAVWIAMGLGVVLLLGQKHIVKESALLLPALASLLVAASGLAFQLLLADDTPVPIYLLRVILAGLSARLFALSMERRDPVVDWLVYAVAVLALAQVTLTPWIGFGYIAAGILAAMGAFPAAALAGLALDLAQITPVPMTAVMSLAYLSRMIPTRQKWFRYCGPVLAYVLVMGLCGMWELHPIPGLILGGACAIFLPGQTKLFHRRGETGVAQVRLEMASSVLRQTQMLLGDVEPLPIDEEALISRAVDRACSSCPCKKTCKDRPQNLPEGILHRPLGNGDDLPLTCRKSGRLLQELRRSQEQLRSIRADRDRQGEYRAAVIQQYGFLSEYLQDLSDVLAQKATPPRVWFQPEIGVCSASQSKENGDTCMWFSGVEGKYYVLLCDGMGTGSDAARDAGIMARLLRKLLSGGYPPEHALRSVNSLCALQGQAGAVTIDLAELQLDTGKVCLYKWGAAPSYLISRGESVKIGTATPPPGLSVNEGRETVERLSLRRGETLVLLSDGAGGEEAVRRSWEATADPPGVLAEKILSYSCEDAGDDATVAVVRLSAAPVTA